MLTGCCTTSPDAANEKVEKSLKQNGYTLEPISMDLEKANIWHDYDSKRLLLKAIQERFSTNQDLVEYLNKVSARVEEFHHGDVELINTLNSNYNENKDLLFYFQQFEKCQTNALWLDETDGWMIVESGKVKFKLITVTGMDYDPDLSSK